MTLLVCAPGSGALKAKCRTQARHTEKFCDPAGQRLLGDAELFGNRGLRASPSGVQAQRD
jgi:hypothetical protein